MKRYSAADEERIRLQSAVREWTRSGLLEAEQGRRLSTEIPPDLKRTNDFLRFVLFVFTVLIVGASMSLIFDVWKIVDRHSTADVCGIAALLCFGLAELVTHRFHLYRFGVEEALVVSAVVLLLVAVNSLVFFADFQTDLGLVLAVCAAAGLLVYARFGFLYSGLAAIVCAALVPFALIHDPVMQRAVAAAIFAAVFVGARRKYVIYGDDFPGDDYNIFQAAAWMGLYVEANLKMTSAGISGGWFYWTTYVLIWILPGAGLFVSLRSKDRYLMDLSIAMALATLATNKAYLGLPHHTWDPILLGILLIAAAVIIRRRLASGMNGERYGFTPVRILNNEARVMTVVGAASAAFQPHQHLAGPAPSKPDFGGGQSGGAGASGKF